MVLHIIDNHFIITFQFLLCRTIIGRIICIAVRLYIQQSHRTMRGRCDGQRDVNRLTVCIRGTRVGRHILVVDIDLTLDEPIVGRHLICALILTTHIIAVVDNRLFAVYKVTRTLPLHL